MKKLFTAGILSLLTAHIAFAQTAAKDLPVATIVNHFKLDVGCNTTTVLIFSAAVKAADRGKGDHEFITQKQAGLENVLKIKGSRKDFTPSNMHVFTSDGKLYAFDVRYQDNPIATTYDLTKLQIPDTLNDKLLPTKTQISGKTLDDDQMADCINRIRQGKRFFSKSSLEYDMKVSLRSIHKCRDLLFFEFQISNRSNLDYSIDFSRLFIHDKQKVKKSSIQETEIVPVYKDSINLIPGNSQIKYILAVPRFTIPDKKQFTLEIFESNGGRSLSLNLRNRHLFKARPL